MKDIGRARLEKLKLRIMVGIALVLVLVEGFAFLVMGVPLVRCALEWLFALSVGLVVVHVGFRYALHVQDRIAGQARRLSALNAITLAVNSCPDLETTLKEALDKALEVLGFERGLIYLCDTQGEQLRIAAQCGFAPDSMAPAEEAAIGDNLSAQVVQTGQPFVGDDPAALPAVCGEMAEAQGTASVVIIPLVARGRVLGTMNLVGAAGRFSGSEDMELLSSIGRQIGLAVENARLHEETQEATHDLSWLRKAMVMVSSSLNTEAILTGVADGMAEAIGADRCVIAVWDVERGVVTSAAEHVSSERVDRLDPRPATGKPRSLHDIPVMAHLMDRPQPLVVDADHPPPDEAVGAWLRASGWAAVLAVPMIARRAIVGVAELYDVRPERRFTARQVELGQAMANQAAMSVENARLYESAIRRLSEMETLHEVGKELTSLVALPQLLQAIVDSAVATIAAAEASTIHLVDKRQGRLMPRAVSNRQLVVAEKGGMPLGQGVAGLACKEKRTIHVPDVTRDPHFITLDTDTSFRSLLVAPLIMGNECLGTISLHSNEPGAFTPDDERLLATLASQAAIALENAQLYEKVAAGMKEARALDRVSNTLMRSLNLEQLLENIPKVLRGAFGYSHSAILLLDEDTGEFQVKATRGYLQAGREGERINLSQKGIVEWVVAHKSPLNVPDVTKDEWYVGEVEGTRSEIAVPMLVGERVVGVLDVQSPEVNAFGEGDLRVLSAVAAQAAIAIERARFFREARRRSREQVILFQASATVLSTLHINEVLHEVAKQMALAVDATSARVCQWDEEKRTVTVIAEYITPHALQKKQVSTLGAVYPVKDYGIFQVLQDRRPLTASLTDPDISGEVRAQLEELGGNTVLYLPLAVKERLIGYVEVWERRRKRHFVQDEINLCQAISNQAAIAIENARLYEQALQDAETKAMLLHEVNHRVGNNLTALIGLLYAERNHAGVKEDAVYQAIMKDLINRVQGLATVHSLLSVSKWKPLLLSELARQIIHAVLRTLPRDKWVSVDVNPSPVRVTPKQAHDLALVINELATNTVKHVLRVQDTARITTHITLDDDTVLFEFRDDGPGYPEEVLRLECHNVGFDLIQTLVRNGLRGRLALHNDHGGVAVIRFEAQAAPDEIGSLV